MRSPDDRPNQQVRRGRTMSQSSLDTTASQFPSIGCADVEVVPVGSHMSKYTGKYWRSRVVASALAIVQVTAMAAGPSGLNFERLNCEGYLTATPNADVSQIDHHIIMQVSYDQVHKVGLVMSDMQSVTMPRALTVSLTDQALSGEEKPEYNELGWAVWISNLSISRRTGHFTMILLVKRRDMPIAESSMMWEGGCEKADIATRKF